MPSRLTQQKPDPEMRKNVRRARADMHSKPDLRALVVGASLATTLGAWGLFSFTNGQAQLDAAAQATTADAQVAAATQASTTAASITIAAQATPTAELAVPDEDVELASQLSTTTQPAATATATAVPQATNTLVPTTASTSQSTRPAAVAVTKSSR